MHLATHGFFEVPERDLALEAAMAEHRELMPPSAMPFAGKQADNPMMHAGLVLAPDPDPTGDDTTTSDGRLTAYEISGWDLRGTELVVLSACDTGLGAVESGEGVFGLRRAFTMAGVQTQVMSLWNAGDNTTTKLMNAYYRKLLAGKGRGEAMREVQLEMLHSPEHHLPGDWASFVVVGEWKPLSADRLPKVEGPPAVPSKHHGCQVGVESNPPPTLLLLALLGLLGRRGSHGSTESQEPR